MSAAGVGASTASIREAGPGASPRAALHALEVKPIPWTVARALFEHHHYLHSMPGGSLLNFGVFRGGSLLGAVALIRGPKMAYSLVEGAKLDDCACLARVWLNDDLPTNSESRVLGVIQHSLRRNTHLKFLVTYADPSQGHLGTIYQATNWLYTGLSAAMPLYDVRDGKVRHSRSLSHAYGSHSVRHFANHGIKVRLVPQAAKHRYIYFLDPSWQPRLKVRVLPYPKKGDGGGRG